MKIDFIKIIDLKETTIENIKKIDYEVRNRCQTKFIRLNIPKQKFN
tara:strand:+ start:156 stop:293 length:138 start_codon:yes stop_codon:yes gene_type:complete